MSGDPVPGTYIIQLEADSDVRLDLLVAARTGVSRSRAATWIATGRVSVNGRQERASYRPRAGETVRVEVPTPEGRDILPEKIPLAVVYEDQDIVVIDKPAGMVVHPAPGHWSGTLVNALLGRGESDALPERAGLVHRLDKNTSGLLLVARNERAHRLLAAELAARRIARRYALLCWGHLPADELTVDRPIGRDPRDRKRMAVVLSGREARTTLIRLARFEAVDLLRAHLHTGRTHQIRVHLASIGHPLVGDDIYGGGGGRRLLRLAPGRQFLHAAWLRFRHPTSGELMDLRSALPADLRPTLAEVARDPTLVDHPDPLALFGFYDAA
jgi:23S rRNA pseudouridine1911/1915/1917 synthase